LCPGRLAEALRPRLLRLLLLRPQYLLLCGSHLLARPLLPLVLVLVLVLVLLPNQWRVWLKRLPLRVCGRLLQLALLSRLRLLQLRLLKL
jgi:hypothetical protein